MGYNYELRQQKLRKVNLDLVKKGVFLAFRDGITSRAPLGWSGDTIILFGDEKEGRRSVISLRNHCGDVELLVTDVNGHFLFCGKYDPNLGIEWVASLHYDTIKRLRPFVEIEVEQKFMKDIKDAPHVEISDGFEWLKIVQSYQSVRDKARQTT